jgi:hypothetical protein
MAVSPVMRAQQCKARSYPHPMTAFDEEWIEA